MPLDIVSTLLEILEGEHGNEPKPKGGGTVSTLLEILAGSRL